MGIVTQLARRQPQAPRSPRADGHRAAWSPPPRGPGARPLTRPRTPSPHLRAARAITDKRGQERRPSRPSGREALRGLSLSFFPPPGVPWPTRAHVSLHFRPSRGPPCHRSGTLSSCRRAREGPREAGRPGDMGTWSRCAPSGRAGDLSLWGRRPPTPPRRGASGRPLGTPAASLSAPRQTASSRAPHWPSRVGPK